MAGKGAPQFTAKENWPHSVVWDKFIMPKDKLYDFPAPSKRLVISCIQNNHQHFEQNSKITKCFHFFLYMTVQKIHTYVELHLMKYLKKKSQTKPLSLLHRHLICHSLKLPIKNILHKGIKLALELLKVWNFFFAAWHFVCYVAGFIQAFAFFIIVCTVKTRCLSKDVQPLT